MLGLTWDQIAFLVFVVLFGAAIFTAFLWATRGMRRTYLDAHYEAIERVGK